MDRLFSMEMRADAMRSVGAAAVNKGIVDVSAVAEEVRLRHLHENVAREDIESLVVQCGAALNAPMEIATFGDLECVGFWSSVARRLDEQPLWALPKSTCYGRPARLEQATQSVH